MKSNTNALEITAFKLRFFKVVILELCFSDKSYWKDDVFLKAKKPRCTCGSSAQQIAAGDANYHDKHSTSSEIGRCASILA